MKGEDKQLVRFIEGNDKCFIIPLYQRNYDWEIKHCRHLFSDLVKLHEENGKSHFFGSIVTGRANEYNDDYYVIDGQQRITTISLLLIALVNAARHKDIVCHNPINIEMIYNTYIINQYHGNDRKVKLKPIKNDMMSFDAIVYDEPERYVRDSNVTRNYELLYDLVKTCGLSLEDIFDAVKRLVVIDIRLEREDDPQLIFESLNSTGLDLSEADKIRNYLLMSMGSAQQEHCYDRYWNRIEEYTDYNPTMFIRDYLTIRNRTISNIDNLYFEFKTFVEREGLSREEVMAEMTEYARYYHMFNKFKSESTRLNVKFRQLATIGSTVGMTFYMVFLKHAYDNGLTAEEMFEVFDIIEGYWARRIMCGYPANAMNKAFAVLHHDVIRLIREETSRGLHASSYAEVLKFVLLKRQGNGVYPGDSTLSEEFKTRQVYRIPMAYRYFLFERMENCDNAEGKWENIVPHMMEGDYTIEHIMPQTLSSTWRQQLGDEAERIHSQYLHTFANLTLTGYNSSYGNRPFADKKYGYDYKGKHVYGFNDSHFSLSNYMKKVEEWTEKELIERQELLYKRFLALWPMITTSFKPVEKETDRVGFDDEETELTGRYIIAFTYKGERHKVASWKDMLVSLCRLLYAESPSSMRILCNAQLWLHDNSGTDNGRTKFADGCYVYSSCSTKTKMSVIRHIFNKMNLPASDLEFELVPLAEASSSISESND